MGSRSRNCVRASTKSGRCSRVEEEGVFYDEQGLFASDDLAVPHVCPVKAHWINAPVQRSVQDDHAHSPLFFSVRLRDCFQAHHVISGPVKTISLVVDIGLRQNNWVKVANPFLPDGLHNPGSPSVADVAFPNRWSLGAQCLEWQWHCVEEVPSMPYHSVDIHGHPGHVPQKYVPY